MDINSYINQHRDILQIMDSLKKQIMVDKFDADAVSETLITISGRIKHHLSMEDAYLYPKSLKSNTSELKVIASKMQEEMVPISTAFRNYILKWTPYRMVAEKSSFIQETNMISDALNKRIDREEKELYPLAKTHIK